MKITQKQQDNAAKILAQFEDARGYSPDRQGRLFDVDVKLHGQKYHSAEDIAARYPKKYAKRIIEKYTDEEISTWLDNDIEFEARYWTEDVPNGYVFEGEDAKKLDLLDGKTFGFYGRSGGHFCFDIVDSTIEEELAMIADGDIENYEHYGYTTPAKRLSEAREILAAVEWFKNQVTQAKKSIESDEFFYGVMDSAVEMDIDDWDSEDKEAREVGRAKKLAEKYGYIIARKV